MFSWTLYYAEEARRAEQIADLLREQQAQTLLGESRSRHPLFALGKRLSELGEQLQARYAPNPDCTHLRKASLHFN